MPTGTALTDARARLFDAAERLLVEGGPAAVTSRSVTVEAGVAKGVLHKHFGDFDTFLAELCLDRLARLDAAGAELRAQAGTGDVVGQVAAALDALCPPVVVALTRLTIARDGVRDRLRAATRTRGLPVLAVAADHLADYLRAEQTAGRVARTGDADILAGTLLASASLLLDAPPGPGRTAELRRTAAAVLAGVVRQRAPRTR